MSTRIETDLLLNSLEILDSALTAFTERCVAGLRINAELNARNADTIIPLLTRLGRQHGYSTVTAVYKEAHGDMDRLRVLLRAQFGETATDGNGGNGWERMGTDVTDECLGP